MFGRRTRQFVGRLTVVALLGGLGLSGAAGTPAAHVRVDDGDRPTQGGYGLVRLIVPTESDTASTVRLTITVPDGVDLVSARTLPIPGWTATILREPTADGERVTRIDWETSDPAYGLKGSEFGVFTLSAGPWPDDVESVALHSEQGYSDGSVVRWDEVALDADSEPEHPAPVVTLAAAGAGHGHDGHGDRVDASTDPASTASAATEPQLWLWRSIAGAALVIAAGSSIGVLVLMRRSHVPKP